MPWVTPSAENLFFSGELEADWIGDDVQADWARCQTLGGTRPKPDYTAGLLRKAFTREEVRKLQIYSALSRPFLFTAELSYPFLICEAKSGDEGLNKAHRQNIHSASIAVNAIIELYKAAFAKRDPGRVDELYGKILVFTISHNHDIVYIYGHYAAFAEDSDNIEFYRYQIVSFSLTVEEGRDRYKPYNFVRNLYAKFAFEHRERIKEAAAQLELPRERTGLSFNASSLVLDEGDPQPNSQDTLSEGDSAFLLPGTPASASRNGQLNPIKSQVDQQRQANGKLQEMNDSLQSQVSQLLEQLDRMERRREEERAELKQEREQERDAMKQERDDMKQERDDMRKQIGRLMALLEER